MTGQLANPERAIFNIHVPPFNSRLDTAPLLGQDLKVKTSAGAQMTAPVGSVAVRGAIEEVQPLLGLHGHIHESGGSVKIGRTTAINVGSHDFRRILQNQIEDAASLGYRMNMGVEPEVYVLRDTEHGVRPWVAEDLYNAPTRGYDLQTTMLADRFLEPMVEYMNELGWDVYSFDHEGGDGQYEFDFGYTDALTMADRMLIFRLMAKHVARTLGCFASFIPSRSRPRSAPAPTSMSASLTSAPAGTSSTAACRGISPTCRMRRPTGRSAISSPPACWPTAPR